MLATLSSACRRVDDLRPPRNASRLSSSHWPVLVIMAFVSLTAMSCGAQEAPAPVQAPVVIEQDQPLASPMSGQWTLTRLEGRQPQLDGWPVTLSIAETTIQAQSQCLPFRWTYIVNGGALTAERVVIYGPDGDPLPVCTRGLTEWEQRFTSLMDDATTAILRDETLIIAADDRLMTFGRQAEAPLP